MSSRPPLLAEIPYTPDSSRLFAALAGQPWAMFLDSGRPHTEAGRYDILVAEPVATISCRGAVTEVTDRDGVRRLGDDPFAVLQAELARYRAVPMAELPFAGGAVGYFAYDLARRLERLPALAVDGEGTPELAVGIYDWALVVDHQARRSTLVGQGNDPATAERWEHWRALFSAPPAETAREPLQLTGPLRSNLERAAYGRAFARIQEYIRAGDCYQVNLAQRFAGPAAGDPWAGYCALRRDNPAPFAAYLNTPAAQVLSCSPERFLAVRDGQVETRPIKGTRPRRTEPAADAVEREALRKSAKDRAENLMIVDLLRNDLGKNCAVGSVRVEELFAVESFASVHHLVSTIRGRLAPGRDSLDLLRGCFPGGSITGAPKLRAMSIIEELEPHRRGVYCGAIGYVGFDGGMDTNIAIRTMVHGGGELRFWAGGGIVADSEEGAEYQETLDKAAAMLRLLQGEAAAEPPPGAVSRS